MGKVPALSWVEMAGIRVTTRCPSSQAHVVSNARPKGIVQSHARKSHPPLLPKVLTLKEMGWPTPPITENRRCGFYTAQLWISPHLAILERTMCVILSVYGDVNVRVELVQFPYRTYRFRIPQIPLM